VTSRRVDLSPLGRHADQRTDRREQHELADMTLLEERALGIGDAFEG
jgi:hypothetical protein